MKKICDEDIGGKTNKGKFLKEKGYKFIILDNSGGIALFGNEETYRLPDLNEYKDVIEVDGVVAEVNSKMMDISVERSEDKINKELEVFVAKVRKKDDINVKWARPEEALMFVSKYKKNIDEYEYERKFDIQSDEMILREYIIKYIY